MGLRWILKSFLPPVISGLPHQLGKLFRGRAARAPEWEIASDGWQTDNPRIKGWDVTSVVETQRAKWPEFVRSMRGYGPLGVAHEAAAAAGSDYASHNVLMSYAYVLALAARQKDTISVLDWGGGIGHYCVISRALLPAMEIEYHCRDLPLFCQCGKEVLPGETFHDDDDCFRRSYDLVLASGSLQYVEDWRTTVASLVAATGSYLFITRLPVVHSADSFVVVQRPYRFGYDTEYLSWRFNRGEFLDHMETLGVELVREFLIWGQVDIHNAPEPCEFRGYLFRPAQPTSASQE
ncbi:MAG: methyltransferase, TIGR04325 family [Planctomycetota bacterium]